MPGAGRSSQELRKSEYIEKQHGMSKSSEKGLWARL